MSFEFDEVEPCTVLQAVRAGDVDELERLLAEGNPTDTYDNRGWRPIHEATNGNYISCLQRLLQIDTVDINWQSYDGVTSLLLACRNNYIDCVEILLKANANANIADHVDNFPLHEAVKADSLNMVKLLVEYGCNINCQLYCGTSPLHTSVAEGMLEITKYLLQNGASLETKEEYNITPIFTAAQFGQADCLSYMLEHAKETNPAALVNYPAEDGATPIFLASQEGNYDCVKILLEQGADPNIMTVNEPRALPVQAALEFGHLKIASLLLPATNQEYFKDCDCSPWYTVLTTTDYQVRKKSVQLLIEHGADVNYKHTKDMEETYTRFPKILRFLPTESMLFLKCVSPLTMSMIFESGKLRSPIVDNLINHGAHVNAERLYEFPPIIPALEGRKVELAKMLIRCGANVNLYHPKLQGNFAVLLCMHQWKSFNLLLKVGAEVESLFDASKYLYELDNTLEKFKAKKEVEKSVEVKEADIDVFGTGASTSVESTTVSLDPDEASQIHILESNSFIPFETFLVAARHVMSAGPYKVRINAVLYKMLYFSANVNIQENLWSFLESKEDEVDLRKLTDNPRTLAHLCRLVVRKQLGSVRLINEDETRKEFHLPKNIWDFVYFHEVED